MAATRYDDLDDEEEDLPPVFDSLSLPPPAPRRKGLPWRPIALGVGAAALLGGGLYVALATDWLESGPHQPEGPRLALPLPERLPATDPTALASAPAAPAESAGAATPAVPVPAAARAAPPPRAEEPGVPQQPHARGGADKPPSFDALPDLKTAGKPLPAAPLRDLLRRAPAGDLPSPGADGREPRQAYARPWDGPADQARVAVVVADLGLDRIATEVAINRLPPEVTLAFSPYAANLDQWIRKARDHGHEVLMVVPADGGAGIPVDPGPFGLVGAAAPESNLGRLETVMARGPGAAGLMLQGDGFADAAEAQMVLGTARDRGLLFVGPGGAPPERTPALAAITSVIDRDLFREAIDFRLNQVAMNARQGGRAVVVLHPRPLSFERLVGWLGQLSPNRLVLAPVSALTAPPPPPPAKS
ncbi:MAG: hypothetical protein RLZZ501_217 [Pseudomonadota bacterium]|jgi:polysaccharide deacetylase 2 family uncharacterized protein YibQ